MAAGEESDVDVPEKQRTIRYDAEQVNLRNEVSTSFALPPLRRSNTSGSAMSTASARSRARSVDPAIALPIEYRTLSFNIEQTREREIAEAKSAKEKAAKDVGDLDWHLIDLSELCTRLSTSLSQGLSIDQVARKTKEFGKNVPSKPPSRLPQKLFGYFFGGFGSILLVASILVFICWKPLGDPPAVANLALGIVLAAVFFIQAAFNAWQDFSSSRVMDSITGMLPEGTLVLRDGRQQQIDAADVVPGDVLYFKAGNKLPADVRFIEVSSDSKFDRSVLTGESLPLGATTKSTDDNYLETRCIGMQGTHCTSGSGIAIVVSTGDRTIFGRIAKLTSTPSTARTPLQKEILRFVLIIVSLMVLMNVIVLIVYGAYLKENHPSWITTPILIIDIVSVAVAFVPEGLPIALTASLTITAKAMAKNNILCKSLRTVESLGAVSVLLSDKTGTLTKNQMKAADCMVGFTSLKAKDAIEQIKKDEESGAFQSLQQLRATAAICNAGEFDVATLNKPLDDRTIIGDATDQAVLRFSESLGSVSETKNLWRKVFEIPFNSKNKFMVRITARAELKNNLGVIQALSPAEAADFADDSLLLTIKGAPDILLERCTQYLGEDGHVHDLDDGIRAVIEGVKDNWSGQGKRVISLARKVLPNETVELTPTDGRFEDATMEYAASGLIFVGLVGIVDPPRDEIPGVVQTLRGAGIKIMMVTGDFKLTAQAIAAQCGIITMPAEAVHSVHDLPRSPSENGSGDTTTRTSIVMNGPELIMLNEHQWDTLCGYSEVVFARTTPDQKLRIVKEYQKRENIVGMTGDGVNDAPSLKQADIGIAPGSGSDIALEAADMVLLDSFSAIAEAVLYGRLAFDNLKKTIAYLLPAGSFSEFWPVMTSVLFGLPQILSSFLMIIICCFTDCAAATMLAYEKPEADLMIRKPRNAKRDRLVDWRLLSWSYGFIGIIETTLSFTMSYWYAQRHGLPFSALWFGYGAVPSNITSERYTEVLNTASSIYFVNLVVMQFFTLMAVRTRRLSIFSHPPFWFAKAGKKTQNWRLIPAIIFAIVIVFIFCYPPSVQAVLATTTVPVEHWFLPLSFGVGVLCLDEGRKAVVRRWPNGLLAKCAW